MRVSRSARTSRTTSRIKRRVDSWKSLQAAASRPRGPALICHAGQPSSTTARAAAHSGALPLNSPQACCCTCQRAQARTSCFSPRKASSGTTSSAQPTSASGSACRCARTSSTYSLRLRLRAPSSSAGSRSAGLGATGASCTGTQISGAGLSLLSCLRPREAVTLPLCASAGFLDGKVERGGWGAFGMQWHIMRRRRAQSSGRHAHSPSSRLVTHSW